jgi:hypothetical protein
MADTEKTPLDRKHGAATAVGVGIELMLVALEHILPLWVAPTLWGLLFAIGFLLFLYGVSPLIAAPVQRWRRQGNRQMIALAGMAVCGAGFFGFAGVYFWPSRPVSVSASLPSENARPAPEVPPPSSVASSADGTPPFRLVTLHDVFAADMKVGGFWGTFPLAGADGRSGPSIDEGVVWNFEARSLYYSFYVPRSTLAFDTTLAFDVCMSIAAGWDDYQGCSTLYTTDRRG